MVKFDDKQNILTVNNKGENHVFYLRYMDNLDNYFQELIQKKIATEENDFLPKFKYDIIYTKILKYMEDKKVGNAPNNALLFKPQSIKSIFFAKIRELEI